MCVFVEPILISRASDAKVLSKQVPLRCCDAETGLIPESHTDTRPDPTGLPACRLMIHIIDPAGPRARDMRILKHYANSKNYHNINLLGGKHTCCILLCRITELLQAIDRYVLLYLHSVQ